MSLVFLMTGKAHLGINRVDKDGNTMEHKPGRFEFADDGPCVAVGELDPETMEIKDGSADIYAGWDAAGYIADALSRLKPGRHVNIPDFKTMVRRLWEDAGIDICDHCPNFGCSDCIVNDWKNEEE